MNTLFVPFFLFSFLASTIFAQAPAPTPTFSVNTPPNPTQCRNTSLSWTDDGKPPYDISIMPIAAAADHNQKSLRDLGQQNGTSLSWKVDLAVDTLFFVQGIDSGGTVAQSGTLTVIAPLPGMDASCATETASATPTTSGSSISGSASSTSGSVRSGSATSARGASSTTSGSSATQSSAAASQFAPIGALAGAAVFALGLVLML